MELIIFFLIVQRYGDVKEIWFDGAKGSNAPNMTYYFDDWFAMVRELQSTINIFSDAGPGVRWVGNEDGFAGSTSWSTINRTLLSIGNSNAEYVNYFLPSLNTIISLIIVCASCIQ